MTSPGAGSRSAQVAHQAVTLLQGDLLSGLAVAVAGLGAPPVLPDGADLRRPVSRDELWTITFTAPSGWYAICSQDCDLARGAETEPTITVAPVVWLPHERWRAAAADSYSPRFLALPEPVMDDAPVGCAPAVDLSWMTSIAKGSLADGDVQVRHPLTGPQRRRFATWLGWRAARAPFPDDVVRAVLDPAYHVRSRLMGRYDKAVRANQLAPVEVRLVGACVAWYARLQSPNVQLLGRVTPASLMAAGFVDADGDVREDDLATATRRLAAQTRQRMQREAPNSGFGTSVVVRSFDQLRADEAETFSLLMR